MSDDATKVNIATWLIDQGLQGVSQEKLLENYCIKLVSCGIPVQRVHVAQRATHPVFGSIGFNWHRDSGIVQERFPHTSTTADSWNKSPFYFMMKNGVRELREGLTDVEHPHRFPILDDLRANGATDYFAIVLPFGQLTGNFQVDPNNTPEGIVISWSSDAVGGFSDANLDVLRHHLAPLSLSLKSASNNKLAYDLLKIYLGDDAGSRVLSGGIQRGSLDTIQAVIWYFDLQGFTRLAETNSGASIVAMLNDYFGSVVNIVEDHGGNVLKFMGDGLLAIFSFADQDDASQASVTAAGALDIAMNEINTRRQSQALPHTEYALALHTGEVQYGNIGADNRLDFTVIGSAVNKTARILGMCASLQQNLAISSQVANSLPVQRNDLVSLGCYMLRGVPEPQELFTIYTPAVEDD